MSARSKKKEPRYAFCFSLKKPLQVPQQWPLWRELPVYKASLHISQIPHKIPLSKEFFFLPSQRHHKMNIPTCSPKAGPLRKQTPISRALLSTSFRIPSKGALPPGSLHRAPSERDVPLVGPSIHLSKSLVYGPPSWCPSSVPMERDACLQSFSLHLIS